MSGNVTVKGQVFIRGDEAGSDRGQTALRVRGRLHLEDGAQLAAYGGAGKVLLNAKGGNAIELEEGSKIDGKGKVIAIGGDVLWGDGGNAISGKGNIETAEAFLQGANASKLRNSNPGKAIAGEVKVTSFRQHIADGAQSEAIGADDPLLKLYWRTGIDPTPALDLYQTQEVKPQDPEEEDPSPKKPETDEQKKSGADDSGRENQGKEKPKTDDSGRENLRRPETEDSGIKKQDQVSARIRANGKSVSDQKTALGSQKTDKSRKSAQNRQNSKGQEVTAAKTGDEQSLLIGIAVALLAGGLLTWVRLAIIKRRRNEK